MSEPQPRFVYIIGETTTYGNIIADALELFKKKDKSELKELELVILHTLVTLNNSLELKRDLEPFFKYVTSFLVPATEYNIMRTLTKTLDYNSTIINIVGGSWTIAASLATELKKAKIFVLKKEFVKKKSDNIEAKEHKGNDQENITPPKEYKPLPQEPQLFCVFCDNQLVKYQILSNQKDAFPVCNNENCSNFNKRTTAYSAAPSGMLCWRCQNPITRYIVRINYSEQYFELRPFCVECNEPRERHLKIIDFSQ